MKPLSHMVSLLLPGWLYDRLPICVQAWLVSHTSSLLIRTHYTI